MQYWAKFSDLVLQIMSNVARVWQVSTVRDLTAYNVVAASDLSINGKASALALSLAPAVISSNNERAYSSWVVKYTLLPPGSF